MNKLSVIVCCAMGLACMGLSMEKAQAAEQKIAYVDMQKAFAGYKKAKDNEDVFKKEVTAEQEKLNKVQEDIKKKQEEFEKQKDLLKAEDKKKKEDDLKAELQKFSEMWRDVNQKLDKRREELETACIKDIMGAAKEYGKKNGYSLILDSRVVIFGADTVDVSAEIVKSLNK